MTHKIINVLVAMGCILVIVTLISIYLFFKPSNEDNLSNTAAVVQNSVNSVNSTKYTHVLNDENVASGVRATSQNNAGLASINNILSDELKSVKQIADSKILSPEQKRQQLLPILMATKDAETQSAIIRFFALNASLDTTDKIKPFLYSNNAEVQKDAIDALLNYAIEFQLGIENDESTAAQKAEYKIMLDSIRTSIDTLYYSPLSNEQARQAIESRYMALTPSASTVGMISQAVLSRPLTESSLQFIGSSLLTKDSPYKNTMSRIQTLGDDNKHKIANELKTQMVLMSDENNILDLPTSQIAEIKRFVEQYATEN